MTYLLTHRRDVPSCLSMKPSHLRKWSNRALRTSTLVSDGTPGSTQSTADFVSALSNVNEVKISDLLEFVVMLLFPLFSPKNCLQKVTRLWKHPWGEIFFFDNFKKSLVETSFHFHLQLCKKILEWQLSYEVTSCNLTSARTSKIKIL